jgi:murein DD-endopeptidase MepM/ murein hydrolase activator NlpD
MTRRLSTPRRICVIALCACAATFLITPTPTAWAAGACAANGKPLADGTFTRSSPFGPRGAEFHRGMDLAGKIGTSIFASMDGKVVQAGPASGFGNWIVIDSQTSTGVVSTVYGHMFDDGVLVKPGATVKEGDHIANIGNNGHICTSSTGGAVGSVAVRPSIRPSCSTNLRPATPPRHRSRRPRTARPRW